MKAVEAATEEGSDADGEYDLDEGSREIVLEDEQEEGEEPDQSMDEQEDDWRNDSDSDREYKADDETDIELDPLPDDGIPLATPYKVATYPGDDLQPMLLYDVRIAMPKTVVRLYYHYCSVKISGQFR